ncbi:hypothetical protein [Saccharomonospora sp. NB11]|uniref:hypothetical protein n=1 Tax=Saccharomonospora sp. NB11 TaxID=1642298 RepID=UPI0018D154BD|nr:hypothetical protein [Saccharomonospora sp. NB11]
MRVVRFPTRPTRVADDVRAALTSLGRGQSVVGGVAVLGVTPPDSDLRLDAVLVLPRGVFVVVGVDLPDPAMVLSAPLHAEWKADGWPLVRPDREDATEVNPGLPALALAGRLADRVHAVDPTIAVGVVIAVGPYVKTVEQPPEDAAGPVRVVYPTAASILDALDALPVTPRRLTTQQLRAVLADLAPDAPEFEDAVLIAEGFSTATPPADPAPAVPPSRVSPAGPPDTPPMSSQDTFRSSPRRRVALAAAALFVVTLIAVTVLTVSSREAPPPAAAGPGSGQEAPVTVAGVAFTPVARDAASRCGPHHAVGDVQSFLLEHGCVELLRGSFTTTVDGRSVSVSVGAVTFADDTVAGRFEELATTPGTGILTDVATEAGRWAHTAPTFEGAAYTTRRDGATVRTVLAQVDDPAGKEEKLTSRVAQTALDLPLR